MIVARRIYPTVLESVWISAKRWHGRIERWLDNVQWDRLLCHTIGHTTPWEKPNYNVRNHKREPVFICRRCKQVFGGIRL